MNIKDEVLAVIYALKHDGADRCRLLEEIVGASVALPHFTRELKRQAIEMPYITLEDAKALLERPVLKKEKNAIESEIGLTVFESGHDPEKLAGALSSLKKSAIDNREALRIQEAKDALHVGGKDVWQRILDIATERHQKKQASPAELWDRIISAQSAPTPSSQDVIRLQEERGDWAEWINDHLGERGGLEAGSTLMIGGAAGAGKTSFGAALAIDALSANCPVLFIQLELSAEETLKHLQRQNSYEKDWHERNPLRPIRELPANWQLLNIPEAPTTDATTIADEIAYFARKSAKERSADTARHKINGLIVVDYLQLLTDTAAPRQSQQELLTSATSKLAKAAANSGAALVLLSQLTKSNQERGTAGGTALRGADLLPIASCVLMVQKGVRDGERLEAAGDAVDAEIITPKDQKPYALRVLSWAKTRGIRYRENTPSRHAVGVVRETSSIREATDIT
jgi:RecA/RadA recombinase